MPAAATTAVAGRSLRLTNLDKVLYPATGTTKGDVIDYYVAIAPALIGLAAGRPVTRKRWVEGVGTAAEPAPGFFRKDLEPDAPVWVPRVTYRHKERTNTYPLATEAAVLAWFGQLAALELHVPQWRVDAGGRRSNHDRLVLDLDPGPGAGLAECAEVARLCREVLEGMGLTAVPVTSGSTGIHLYARLDGSTTSEHASAVAKELARAIEADRPDLAVSTMRKDLRGGKVLIDWSQNNAAKTTICPYSLRGRPRPTVAAPRTWEEIDDPRLAQLQYRQVLERVAAGIDPMSPFGLRSSVADDRLATYRSMRDPARTPEPVPADPPQLRTGEKIFVIQEHHASRLHWDVRLERDGVLASWAVPKGPPLETGSNRLAVRVEDHPLSYATFSGTIPTGEYGAGTVQIWDSGTYTAEKWREGEEVIVVLHPAASDSPGSPDSPGSSDGTGGLGGLDRRYALIHTGGKPEDEQNWLLHLMKEQPERTRAGGADGAAQRLMREAGTASSVGSPQADTTGSAHPLTRSTLPAPMLATAGSAADLDREAGWRMEMKWDGVRAIAFTSASGEVTLLSRNGTDLTPAYPELAELADLAPPRSVLDGEIVALNGHGAPDFGVLQRRMNLSTPARVEAERERTPVHFMVFDALQLRAADGEPRRLLRAPYAERRAELEAQVGEGEFVHVPPVHGDDLEAAMRTSRELRLEGVLAKRDDSHYTSGRRTRDWIKIKHERHQEVVVIGWRPRAENAEELASLLLAVPEDGRLRYAGRVGTGLRQADRADIPRALHSLERKTPPAGDIPAAIARDARWVRPTRVGEVRHAGPTRAGVLRQPVWRGWRPEVSAEEVRWEA
ncbi:ATP-dependent DNA ligase [Pseudactinotalea sp. HY160]|uniref:ATP-dependent DNA ligase n=1 Tax=Pseudactinotalea sp. HY160 TaxID=2654490 RepID=UPI00128C435D|nr:ATP-dependent DNA ligase [Pseudactinotalea sp. HY160]MPV49708.1 ATP-dependent DNA ligase [Pseudactinotalea sp. HY160]